MKKTCKCLSVLGVFVGLTVFTLSGASFADESKGKQLYTSCASCHSAGNKNLAGKDEGYLLSKMQAFRAGNKGKMTQLLQAMSEEDVKVLAKYISGMK